MTLYSSNECGLSVDVQATNGIMTFAANDTCTYQCACVAHMHAFCAQRASTGFAVLMTSRHLHQVIDWSTCARNFSQHRCTCRCCAISHDLVIIRQLQQRCIAILGKWGLVPVQRRMQIVDHGLSCSLLQLQLNKVQLHIFSIAADPRLAIKALLRSKINCDRYTQSLHHSIVVHHGVLQWQAQDTVSRPR